MSFFPLVLYYKGLWHEKPFCFLLPVHNLHSVIYPSPRAAAGAQHPLGSWGEARWGFKPIAVMHPAPQPRHSQPGEPVAQRWGRDINPVFVRLTLNRQDKQIGGMNHVGLFTMQDLQGFFVLPLVS